MMTPYIKLFEKNQLDCFFLMSSVDLGKPEKLRFYNFIWNIKYRLKLPLTN